MNSLNNPPPARSAGEHMWRELDVRIYPTPSGCRAVVFTRLRRGADHWDRHLDSVDVDLGEGAGFGDKGAVLLAVSDALARLAHRTDTSVPHGP